MPGPPVGSSVPPGEIALSLLMGAIATGRSVHLEPRGRCMEPLIRNGDRVEVLRGDPRPGAVALIRDGVGELACHRVLAATEGALLTAGDRSATVREHPRDDAIGIVCSVERGPSRLRLDGGWARRLGRLQAKVHLSRLPRRSFAARWAFRLLRRLLVESHRVVWLASEATRRASISGTSSVRRPAASR